MFLLLPTGTPITIRTMEMNVNSSSYKSQQHEPMILRHPFRRTMIKKEKTLKMYIMFLSVLSYHSYETKHGEAFLFL